MKERNDPIQIGNAHWAYEDGAGLGVYCAHADKETGISGTFIGTIRWATMRAALRRHDSKRVILAARKGVAKHGA